jgi:CheY-like chemotaxis protein
MKKPIILVADDDAALVRALALRLRRDGYDVVEAADGYNALARSVEQKPDVLILDINMPAGSGFSVHERKSKVAPHRDAPVIYITGDASDQAMTRAVRLGAFTLLRKPLDYYTLLAAVQNALQPKAA